MNSHVMTSEIGGYSPDPTTIAFVRLIERQNAWRIFPYGEWAEAGGSKVIFDRQYRPICRVHVDGPVEIVSPETWITYTKERHYHRGFGPSPDAETRTIVLRIMEAYGVEFELRRRRELSRRGLLPRWASDPRRPTVNRSGVYNG